MVPARTARDETMERIALGFAVSMLLILGGHPAGATFPGENGTVAFSVTTTETTHIFTIDPDGGHRTNVTPATARDSYAPAWSSDGSALVVVSSRRGPDRLVTMNGDGSGRTVVFQARRWPGLSDPAWSPDGGQIAVGVYNSRDGAQIAIVEVDGSGYSVIRSRAYRFAPDWSPDGTRIAFDQWGETSLIRTMDPDGTNVSTVTEGSAPSWSPDGLRIVFQGGHRRSDVYVVDADGTDGTQLTETAAHWETTPVFSPDGTAIAFSRTIRQTSDSPDDIWVMDADGSNASKITHTRRIDEGDLSWQPV
jgi:TolB protein